MGTVAFGLYESVPKDCIHQSLHRLRLDTYIAGINEHAQGITKQLKVENTLECVGRMNSIRAYAMEVVLWCYLAYTSD